MPPRTHNWRGKRKGLLPRGTLAKIEDQIWPELIGGCYMSPELLKKERNKRKSDAYYMRHREAILQKKKAYHFDKIYR